MDIEESEMAKKGRVNEQIIIYKNLRPSHNRLLIGTPTRGIIRMEWAQTRYGQVIPPNWMAAHSAVGFSNAVPLGYLVDDAQNIIVQTAVTQNYEWLFLHEDDVILPIDCFVRLNEYIKKGDIPVISGLYTLKANPTEPLAYRGRGNGCYDKFKLGDLVWVDGVPTGCLLVHCSILKLMWEESPDYRTGNGSGPTVRKVFETPAKAWFDPEKMTLEQASGTSDLYWCDRVMRENVLERAGWRKIAKRRYPFLIDTNIRCMHIDLNTGTQYPLGGYKS